MGFKNHEHIVFTKKNGALGISYVLYLHLVKNGFETVHNG